MTITFRIGCGMILALLVRGMSHPTLRQMEHKETIQALSPTQSPSLLSTNVEKTLIPTQFNAASVEASSAAAAAAAEEESSSLAPTNTSWQWPLQTFRILFIERPDDDLVLAERLGDYLTQQLQLVYSNNNNINDDDVHVQLELITSHMDWIEQLFVYQFSGYMSRSVPPRRDRDIVELQRLQQAILADKDALHAFWDNEPVLLYYVPPRIVEPDRPDNGKWTVIAAVTFGGVLCGILVIWAVCHRLRSVQPKPDDNDDDDDDDDDEVASVAWSTPMGKVIIPAIRYAPTSPTPDNSMSASPIRPPVHHFETDSILMDGYSDPENEDEPTQPKSKQFQKKPSLKQRQRQDTIQQHTEATSTHPSTVPVYTKKTLFSADDDSLPLAEERDGTVSSEDNDVLGYYRRRKRSSY